MIRFQLLSFSHLLLVALLVIRPSGEPATAQQPAPGQGVAIQLPSVSNFSINTVVMAPDAGATRLGGIHRGSSGRSTAGVPLLSGVPGVSPLFRSQGLGSSYSTGSASVQAHIVISSEIEDEVLAEAERRIATRRSIDPNGSLNVQRRAAFLSRNIGRK